MAKKNLSKRVKKLLKEWRERRIMKKYQRVQRQIAGIKKMERDIAKVRKHLRRK